MITIIEIGSTIIMDIMMMEKMDTKTIVVKIKMPRVMVGIRIVVGQERTIKSNFSLPRPGTLAKLQ